MRKSPLIIIILMIIAQPLKPLSFVHKQETPSFPWRFAYLDPDSGDLWIIDMDGGNKRQVVEGERIDEMAWSYNGKYLAYSYSLEGEIYYNYNTRILDVETSQIVADFPGVGFIQWSGSDYRFIYVQYKDKSISPYGIFDLQSNQKKQLVIGDKEKIIKWSITGKYLVTSKCNRLSGEFGMGCEKGTYFVIYDLELGISIGQIPVAGYMIPVVKISPDESKLAFITSCLLGMDERFRDHLVVVGIDGSDLRVFSSPSINVCSDNSGAYPDGDPDNLFTFTEDSTSILFVEDVLKSEAKKLDLNTGEITPIRQLPEYSFLSFSPDGKWIDYGSQPFYEDYKPRRVEHLYRNEGYTIDVKGYKWTWGKIENDDQFLKEISKFNDQSKKKLDEILKDHFEVAVDGDYMANMISEDGAKMIVDVSFGVVEILLGGAKTIKEVGKLKKMPNVVIPGVNMDEKMNELFVGDLGFSKRDTQILQEAFKGGEILFNNESFRLEFMNTWVARGLRKVGLYSVEKASEAGVIQGITPDNATQDAIEQVLAWFMKQPSPFSNYHTELIKRSQNYQNSLDKQFVQTKDQLPDYSDEEKALFIKDLDARLIAGRWARDALYRQAFPLSQTVDLAQDSWAFLLDLFWEWLMWGAPVLINTIFDGPAWFVSGIKLGFTVGETIRKVHDDFRQLEEDEQLVSLALSISSGFDREMERTYANSAGALWNIRNGTFPQIPEVSIDVSRHISSGYYRLFGQEWWIEKSSYSELKVSNVGNWLTCYDIYAHYNYTSRNLSQLLASLFNQAVSQFSICLEPGETMPVDMLYKTESSGESPDENSTITFQIIGITTTGMYGLKEFTSEYHPQREEISGDSGALTASTSVLSPLMAMEDAKTIPFPITTMLAQEQGTRIYHLLVDINNPFEQEVVVHLEQSLSAGWKVIESPQTEFSGRQLAWLMSLKPGEWHHFKVTLEWTGENGLDLELPELKADFHNQASGKMQLKASSLKVSGPPLVWSDVTFANILYRQMDDAANILLRNLSTNNEIKVEVELCVSSLASQVLDCTNELTSLKPGSEKRVTLPIELNKAPDELVEIQIWISDPQGRELVDSCIVEMVDEIKRAEVLEQTVQPTTNLEVKVPERPVQPRSDLLLSISSPFIIGIIAIGILALIGSLSFAGIWFLRMSKPKHKKQTQPASRKPISSIDPVKISIKNAIDQVKSGNTTKGYAELQKIVRQNPDNADAWLFTGLAAAKTGDLRTAERYLLKAQEMGHPKALEALDWLRKQ